MDAKVLLCDFAEVSGGKLFVSGAGIGMVASATPVAPYRTSLSLAILVMLDITDTDTPHKMTIELVHTANGSESRVLLNDELPEDSDPADQGMIIAQFLVPRNAQMDPADELTLPMAMPLFGLPLPALGGYYFSVRVDGREMDRCSFRAVLPAPPQAGPPTQAEAEGGVGPLL